MNSYKLTRVTRKRLPLVVPGASEAEAEEEKEVKKEVKKPQAKRPTGKITKKTQPEKRKSVTEETVKAKKKKTEPVM